MRSSWSEYFLDIVDVVASRSKDRSTKVGCVIVGPDKEIRATGYNGFPRGIDDDLDSRHERPEKYFWVEHAERNAIYNAVRVGVPLAGCRLYLRWFPCAECARAIIQSGIVEVVGEEPDLNHPRFGHSFRRSILMLEEAGVRLTLHKEATA